MEVIDSIWDAIEDHKNVTEKVASAWKEEAMAQQCIVEGCAAAETLERMQTLQVCSIGVALFCTLRAHCLGSTNFFVPTQIRCLRPIVLGFMVFKTMMYGSC